MKLVKPHSRLNRKIRYLNKRIKNLHNESKAYSAEAAYWQAILDQSGYTEDEIGWLG